MQALKSKHPGARLVWVDGGDSGPKLARQLRSQGFQGPRGDHPQGGSLGVCGAAPAVGDGADAGVVEPRSAPSKGLRSDAGERLGVAKDGGDPDAVPAPDAGRTGCDVKKVMVSRVYNSVF